MKTVRCRMFMGLFSLFLVFSLGIFSSWTKANAANYPNRPITLVVPYPPGGVTDVSARVYADALGKQLKQPVVATNRAGGAGTIGGNFVVTSKPDGYTLGYFPIQLAVTEVFSYFMDAPYSSKDLRPICNVIEAIMAVTVRADSPWNSLKELVEFAKKNPGLKFGYAGKNLPQYMFFSMLDKREKLGLVFVPITHDSEAITAILGDHIQFSAPIYPSVKSLAEGKKLKILAVGSEKRLEFAPEIPTVLEFGYRRQPHSPLGVYGPKRTPDEVVRTISKATREIAEQPDFRTKLENLGVPMNYQDTATLEKTNVQIKEELSTFFKEEGLVK